MALKSFSTGQRCFAPTDVCLQKDMKHSSALIPQWVEFCSLYFNQPGLALTPTHQIYSAVSWNKGFQPCKTGDKAPVSDLDWRERCEPLRKFFKYVQRLFTEARASIESVGCFHSSCCSDHNSDQREPHDRKQPVWESTEINLSCSHRDS